MLLKTKLAVFVVSISFGFAATASAGVVTIDGDLSEWGVVNLSDGSTGDPSGSGGVNGHSDFGVANVSTHPGVTGTKTAGSGLSFDYHIEDSDDTGVDNFYVGPNYGGQNYDGEFLAVAIENSSQLSIAVVTGQRNDSGFKRYSVGDVRLVIQKPGWASPVTVGIEVGGDAGAQDGSQGNAGVVGAQSAITEGALGTTYVLQNNGYTKGAVLHDANDLASATKYGDTSSTPAVQVSTDQTAGSIWLNPTWILDPISPPQPTQMQFTGGTLLGEADFIFTRDVDPYGTAQHSVIELTFDALALFGQGTQILEAEWRPSCGNDELSMNVTLNSTLIVPEPSTFLLTAIGLFGMGLFSRRRRPRT